MHAYVCVCWHSCWVNMIHMLTFSIKKTCDLFSKVNNACSTGSTALVLAKQLIEGNSAECVLALGFEKMQRGSLKANVRCQQILILNMSCMVSAGRCSGSAVSGARKLIC